MFLNQFLIFLCLSYHIANFLNFWKHPLLFIFGWYWRKLWTNNRNCQKLKKICQFEQNNLTLHIWISYMYPYIGNNIVCLLTLPIFSNVPSLDEYYNFNAYKSSPIHTSRRRESSNCSLVRFDKSSFFLLQTKSQINIGHFKKFSSQLMHTPCRSESSS